MKSMRILLAIIIISYAILGFGAYAQNPSIIMDPTINYQTITPAIDSFSYIGNAETTFVNPPQPIYYGTSTPVDNEGTLGFFPERVLPIQTPTDRDSITSPVALLDIPTARPFHHFPFRSIAHFGDTAFTWELSRYSGEPRSPGCYNPCNRFTRRSYNGPVFAGPGVP